MRALAVSLVLIYHLWPGLLTGGYVGVDVFFVISGFLMTAHLIGRQPRTVRDLAQFWGRRIRRLLPASFLVLAVTAVAVRLFVVPTQWEVIARQIMASALYVQNWVLADTAVDYLAADNAPTPTQHFWSLSLEEQFYLFWPLVILAVVWCAGAWKLPVDLLARVVISAVIAVSLAVSILTTADDAGRAYFITPTRVWELAVGGLVATVVPLAATRLPGPATALLAWSGIAAIVAAGVTFTGETPFPGYTALLPVLGTALVILAGSRRAYSPTGVLRQKPVQWLGDVSYSVYLWHWPLILLVPFATGAALDWFGRMSILVLSLGLAALTKVFVEDRFRSRLPARRLLPTYRFAAVGMAAVMALGGLQLAEVGYRNQLAQEQLASVETSRDPCIGAAAMARGPGECQPETPPRMVPEPALAKDDLPDAYADGCWSSRAFTERPVCTYGNGKTKVALVGNSHAAQWLPALQVLAEKNDWTLSTYLITRCNLTTVPLDFNNAERTRNCLAYGKWVMEQTKGEKFDLVVTSARQSVTVDGESWKTTEEPAVEGYKTYLSEWAASGTKVLVLRDSPFPGTTISSIPDCLAAHPDEPLACAGTPKSWYWMDPLDRAVRELGAPGITAVNLDRFFCADNVCPAVIGSIVAYRDGSHITATYARTLAPYLRGPILAALGEVQAKSDARAHAAGRSPESAARAVSP
ncbi:acyltransferase family protein [Arthrobacter sulfonylureivorans]|uniref:acyltransferase family protein n=1 Tax=Arthrobacter sulfonylureivorans TaxID=2486855 RepID=UPI0039E61D7F